MVWTSGYPILDPDGASIPLMSYFFDYFFNRNNSVNYVSTLIMFYKQHCKSRTSLSFSKFHGRCLAVAYFPPKNRLVLLLNFFDVVIVYFLKPINKEKWCLKPNLYCTYHYIYDQISNVLHICNQSSNVLDIYL